MKFFENFRNLKMHKASGTKFSRSVFFVPLEIKKTAHICTTAHTVLVNTLQKRLCRSLCPLNLKSEINKQPSKHEPAI